LCLSSQSSSLFSNREALLLEMEKYGGMCECQKFRDVMMYQVSLFSCNVPEAVRILADTLWRPGLRQEEVREGGCGQGGGRRR
jgi:processing peptidase subunit alpha